MKSSFHLTINVHCGCTVYDNLLALKCCGLHFVNFIQFFSKHFRLTFIYDPPWENREKGDDTGTLVSHAKQNKISFTRKQRVTTHGSLKFSIVINNTLKREECVHSNKGACQDKKKNQRAK